MDRFFDRLGDLLQTLLGSGSSGSRYYDPRDPDMREAIEELDAYLESGGFEPGQGREAGANRKDGGGAKPVDEALRRDYATLEVAFGAPLAEVRRSYKRLLHKYHPDRFSGEADKQALATEVTQRLNDAFARIERRHRSP